MTLVHPSSVAIPLDCQHLRKWVPKYRVHSKVQSTNRITVVQAVTCKLITCFVLAMSVHSTMDQQENRSIWQKVTQLKSISFG